MIVFQVFGGLLHRLPQFVFFTAHEFFHVRRFYHLREELRTGGKPAGFANDERRGDPFG